MMYFEVKIKHCFVNENNAYQTAKKLFLVPAESWTEAETMMIRFMEQAHKGDSYTITKIVQSKITEIHRLAEPQVEEDLEAPAPMYLKTKCMVNFEVGKGKFKKKPVFGLLKAYEMGDAVYEGTNVMMREAGYEEDFELVKVEKTAFTGIIQSSK